ncbi:hypothetical protein [Nitrosomonas sp.]|uniref:hypothetical protein n=1 Tax=Nitrosomonas sp. TaxID=42353 RepID=UPI0025FEBEB8|nr:hypothetical protein [Nitrosomonas sp.]MCC6916783.1 hypothetical protein [Nitrosomonas sp.]
MQNKAQITINPPHLHDKYENRQHAYEAGQLRRARMHVARLISDFDNRKILPPSLLHLLEACILLETTNSKVLADRLKRKPAAIRADLQKIGHLLAETHGS